MGAPGPHSQHSQDPRAPDPPPRTPWSWRVLGWITVLLVVILLVVWFVWGFRWPPTASDVSLGGPGGGAAGAPVIVAAAAVVGVPAAHAAEGALVVLGGYNLHPREVLVATGETVVFQVQEDERAERPHTVVGGDGAFRSPPLGPGETWSLVLSEPGVYHYHLAERPDVAGTIVVE